MSSGGINKALGGVKISVFIEEAGGGVEENPRGKGNLVNPLREETNSIKLEIKGVVSGVARSIEIKGIKDISIKVLY